MKRPTTDLGSRVTTPMSAETTQLLGPGMVAGSVTLTRAEFGAVNKLYGFTPEKPTPRPPKPEPLAQGADLDARRDHDIAMHSWQSWKDLRPHMQAGADRNAIRHAECDGLRMLAWIAKFVSPGEDPVKVLVRLASDAGWDVDPADVEWCEEE